MNYNSYKVFPTDSSPLFFQPSILSVHLAMGNQEETKNRIIYPDDLFWWLSLGSPQPDVLTESTKNPTDLVKQVQWEPPRWWGTWIWGMWGEVGRNWDYSIWGRTRKGILSPLTGLCPSKWGLGSEELIPRHEATSGGSTNSVSFANTG